jgi:hypothetical protein
MSVKTGLRVRWHSAVRRGGWLCRERGRSVIGAGHGGFFRVLYVYGCNERMGARVIMGHLGFFVRGGSRVARLGRISGLLLAVIGLFNGLAHAAVHARGVTVTLSAQPGTPLDAQARLLATEDMAAAARHGETPLVLVGNAVLALKGEGAEALFVQVQSASLCGSAGCSTDVYLKKQGQWVKVLDSVSGPVEILPTGHGGMKDILVDGTDRWVWKNNSYVDTLALQE